MPTSSKQLPTLALVLHAHLPLVRHPELESSLEEAWLFEALVECYLPLLALTTRLQQRRSTVRFTLVLSPTLVSMLRDKYLQGRFYDYLDQLQALCRRVLRRQRLTPRQRRLLGWHLRRLRLARRRFSAIDGDLAGAWSRLAAGGRVELMTTAITHAYLPLCQASVVRAQLAAGREMHRLVFGSLPAGVWLPECGLDDHVMDILHRLGVGHTVAESHGLLLGVPRPPCGVFAPIRPFAELAVFGRDPAVSRQVWSTRKGYPGHGEYLEFHRDLAGEIAPDLLGSFALPGGDHRPTGIRLRRITGCTEQKRLYRPEQARLVAAGHARHFVGLCRRRLARLQSLLPSPVIVAPYDAELFGHWWHEGPLFLEQAFMEGEHQGAFRFDTLAGYLERWPSHLAERKQRLAAAPAAGRRRPSAPGSRRGRDPHPSAAPAAPGSLRTGPGAVERLGFHAEQQQQRRLCPPAPGRPPDSRYQTVPPGRRPTTPAREPAGPEKSTVGIHAGCGRRSFPAGAYGENLPAGAGRRYDGY